MEISITEKAKSSRFEYVIVDLSALSFIDVDGIETLKFISKLAITKRIGFVRMNGNDVFDKSEFANSSIFFENFFEAVEKTKVNGPNFSEIAASTEGGECDDEY